MRVKNLLVLKRSKVIHKFHFKRHMYGKLYYYLLCKTDILYQISYIGYKISNIGYKISDILIKISYILY